MLKANQKDMPPIQNMMFKVSVKLHSSVAFWVAIVPGILGGDCTTPWKDLFAKLRFQKKKRTLNNGC